MIGQQILLDLCRQGALVEHGISTAKVWIEQLSASFFAGLPFSFLRERKGTVALDALGQTTDMSLGEAPGRKLHQLYILDPSDAYTKEAKQGVGVITDVEEDLDYFRGLENLPQRPSVGTGALEGIFSESRNINKVDGVPWLDEDRYQGKGAVSGKIVALQVDVEAGLRTVAVWQVIEEGL
ncbi:hypothetical protein LTR29_017849 [Friedmanniomyces endolithicus]|nr:hypothetical protein LTR29_017849 [Friedmanniomyces endolithicus]